MSDYKRESVERALYTTEVYSGSYSAGVARRLEAEGWTPPPAPKPTLAISEAALAAFYNIPGMATPDDLRAFLRVWLKEAVTREYDADVPGKIAPAWGRNIYERLTGEEWPK